MLAAMVLLSSCAYKMGYSYRELPRGMKSLHISIFKNDTQSVGPEADFTNHLVQEVRRSRVASIQGKESADGLLEGRIVSIRRIQSANASNPRGDSGSSGLVNLPDGTYVATAFIVTVKVELLLRDRKTKNIVWKQWFEDRDVYDAARLALAGINTSSPNYTESEDKRVIRKLAGVMMKEAVDRLTENF